MEDKGGLSEQIRKMMEQQRAGSNVSNQPISVSKPSKPVEKEKSSFDSYNPAFDRAEYDLDKKSPKKVILIILTLLIVAGIAGGIIYYLMLPKPTKLNAPTTIECIKLTNRVAITVEQNPKADYYEIYIQKEGDAEIKYFKQSSNELYLTTIVNNSPGKYYVWACYGSRNKDLSSDNSEKVVFEFRENLSAPEISYLAGDETTIIWNPVSYANFYKVYYGDNKYFTVTPESATGVVSFDLDKFKTEGINPGIYNIQVQSCASEGAYYNASSLSNGVTFTHKIALAPVTSAVFNRQAGTLTLTLNRLKTPTTQFKVNIDIQGRGTIPFIYSVDAVQNTIVFDQIELSLQKEGYLLTDIRAIDVIAISDGEFVTDSTPVIATIQD